MSGQKPWNEYEAIILLCAARKVIQKEMKRKDAILTVSRELRQMAINNGKDIDSVFRNESGISFQISIMIGMLTNTEVKLHKAPKIFEKMMEMMDKEPEQFESIYKEAKRMIENTDLENLDMDLVSNDDKDFFAFLFDNNIEYIDNRNKGGCLWIQDNDSVRPFITILKKRFGVTFNYRKSTTVFRGSPGWWTMQNHFHFIEDDDLAEPGFPVDILPKEQTAVSSETEQIITLDLNGNAKLTFTKPVYFRLNDHVFEETKPWSHIYVQFMNIMIELYPDKFYSGQILTNGKRFDIGDNLARPSMQAPVELNCGMFLETNLNTLQICGKIKGAMSLVGLSYDNIEIRYIYLNQKKPQSTEDNSGKKNGGACNITPEKETPYAEMVKKILSEKFKYGCRSESPIDLMKFRNYAESYECTLPQSDDELSRLIKNTGTVIDGKVYAVSDDNNQKAIKLIEDVFCSGVGVVYYELFYDKYQDQLKEYGFMTLEMYKSYLENNCLGYYFGHNIMTADGKKTEYEAICEEFERIGGDEPVLIVEELKEKLEFVPEDKIAFNISICPEYLNIGDGKYYRQKYFDITDEDADVIRKFVEAECNNNGFVSVTDIPVDNIREDYYDLPDKALYKAVYNSVLKNDFYMKGKIISKGEGKLDINSILKAYCVNKKECYVSEICDKIVELSGNNNKPHALWLLMTEMIRADADRFVSVDSVHFDVDKIDNILEDIIGNGFVPVKTVTTFALFPSCEEIWNHYLLGSYCDRFSKKYKLCVMQYNDKNAGIICHNDINLDYNQLLSRAVADSGIILNEAVVGKFLFDNGYTARSVYNFIPDIIANAKRIREED